MVFIFNNIAKHLNIKKKYVFLNLPFVKQNSRPYDGVNNLRIKIYRRVKVNTNMIYYYFKYFNVRSSEIIKYLLVASL